MLGLVCQVEALHAASLCQRLVVLFDVSHVHFREHLALICNRQIRILPDLVDRLGKIQFVT